MASEQKNKTAGSRWREKGVSLALFLLSVALVISVPLLICMHREQDRKIQDLKDKLSEKTSAQPADPGIPWRDGDYHLNDVKWFYERAWDQIKWIGGAIVVVIGIIVPSYIAYLQKSAMDIAKEDVERQIADVNEKATKVQEDLADIDAKATKLNERVAANDRLAHTARGSIHFSIGMSAQLSGHVSEAMAHFALATYEELAGHRKTSNLMPIVRRMTETCMDSREGMEAIRSDAYAMKLVTGAIEAIEESDLALVLKTDVQKLKEELRIGDPADTRNA